MRTWIWTLRLGGLVLILASLLTYGAKFATSAYGVFIGRASEDGPPIYIWTTYEQYLMPMAANLVIALICFGVASGLVHLRKLEQKNSQQRAALRYLVNAWKALEDEPEELTAQPTHYVGAPPDLWLNVRRNLAGSPVYGSGGLYEPGDEVRHAPAPIQEVVAPQPIEPRPVTESPKQTTSAVPMPSGVPERYVTEGQAVAMTARDAQLRRLQAAQKKRKSRR